MDNRPNYEEKSDQYRTCLKSTEKQEGKSIFNRFQENSEYLKDTLRFPKLNLYTIPKTLELNASHYFKNLLI